LAPVEFDRDLADASAAICLLRPKHNHGSPGPMVLMARATLPQSVVEALQGAGATEEMIAATSVAFGTWENVPRVQAEGSPRAEASRDAE
jgi:hypothetical protein